MKKLLRLLAISCLVITSLYSEAQCGAGYTQAQLNWDNLDYYYNSGGVAPYVNYVTSTMERTQKFAIGTNYVTIVTSANGMADGVNGTHSGNVSGFTGDDAQFTPSSSGQTITLTFNTEVKNLSFTLYDIDATQKVDLGAKDAGNTSQIITVTTYLGTALSLSPITGIATNPRITGGGSNLANNVNSGTATISVTGPVKTFTISFNAIGTDPVLWLSDITACVTGTFPTNYHKMASVKPFTGQPDYFIVTPDDQSVYMVDPLTGNASLLFTETSKFVNSFGYDQVNHILYYVTDGSSTSTAKNNKQLKKYDFNTETIAVVMSDITTGLNIPTFDAGVESAGAAFYDGALYLGIEGGRSGSTTRRSIIYRIEFDASLNPINAYQVYATDAYNSSGTSLHDWGDFIVKDGVIYDFNTARTNTPTYPNSSYVHYNMMTGQVINTYMNPDPANPYSGQVGMDWQGNLYTFFSDGVSKYNLNGTNGTKVPITLISGGTWPGGAGDASEPFRPKLDFGDAPASYDPASGDPAVHSEDVKLRLGANQDKEWVTKGQTALANSDSYDDGLAYVTNLVPSSGSYLTTVSVYNDTVANATVCAWLDYNGNGVFDPSEGISVSVPKSSSAQNVNLFWPTLSSSLPIGSNTYLRIRITYGSNGMTTANPTGYFNGGEVEDYRVYVNTTPLEVKHSDFNVQLTKTKTAKLTWSSQEESEIAYYIIEKSTDNTNWTTLDFANSKMQAGLVKHETTDMNVAEGITYYRLKTIQKAGKSSLSTIKQIENKTGNFSLLISPNPVISKAFATISSASSEDAVIQVVNDGGIVMYSNKIHLNAGTNSIELPVAGFANGRYIVNITTSSKSLRQSLIVNK